jgi:hypothetical protein
MIWIYLTGALVAAATSFMADWAYRDDDRPPDLTDWAVLIAYSLGWPLAVPGFLIFIAYFELGRWLAVRKARERNAGDFE